MIAEMTIELGVAIAGMGLIVTMMIFFQRSFNSIKDKCLPKEDHKAICSDQQTLNNQAHEYLRDCIETETKTSKERYKILEKKVDDGFGRVDTTLGEVKELIRNRRRSG